MSPARPPLAAGSPFPAPRCIATTKAGRPCSHPAVDGGALCFWHDPNSAEERRELLSQRGKNGRRKVLQRQRERAAAELAPQPLACAAEIRGALERSLAAVEASDAAPVVKAHAVARLCSAALDVLRGLALETEVQELRALILERWPEARDRLGAPTTKGTLQ